MNNNFSKFLKIQILHKSWKNSALFQICKTIFFNKEKEKRTQIITFECGQAKGIKECEYYYYGVNFWNKSFSINYDECPNWEKFFMY